MKIVRLEVENFKRLKAVRITPDGALVQIRGQNEAGKSSVLDAIWAALGGAKASPDVPIRKGQDKAAVTLDLDNGIKVISKWSAKGRVLEVTSKEGASFKSPQAHLDALVGSLTFDPLAFLHLEPAKQESLLREISGCQTGELDAEFRRLYEERTQVNRDVERLRAQVPPPVVDAVPDEEQTVVAVMEELEAAGAVTKANALKREALVQAKEAYTAKKAEIADLEKAVAAAREKLATLEETGKRLKKEATGLKDPDLDALKAKAKSVEATNAKVRQKRERATKQAEAEAKAKEATDLTAKLTEIERQKIAKVAEAKFPIAGLGFADGAVTFDGLPLKQASQAQQLRVAIAMALALNPKLRILLIREASLLDTESLALVAKMAHDGDAQVWAEIVGTGPTGVIIEDGEIVDPEVAKALEKDAKPKEENLTGAPVVDPSGKVVGAVLADNRASKPAEPEAKEDGCPF